MSAFQGAPLRGRHSAAKSLTSPIKSPKRPGRRKTIDSYGSSLENSPQSPTDGWHDKDESRIGVKRACNECRQQKLRCDVVQEPFAACSRCKRCQLDCRIDANFKRVGKRKRNAEMEQEIVDLKRQLADKAAPAGADSMPEAQSNLDQYMGSHEAVASLLDLKSGERSFLSPNPSKPSRRLEDVVVTHEQIEELFKIFFTHYHPLQPLLTTGKNPDVYYDACPLLFWSVVSVAARHYSPQILKTLSSALTRLLWATVSDVPQSYLVVKALCLLCVWPLPISSTSSDPTLMISGLMMQISLQIGLHRPSHAQDFSKFHIDLREEELKDRVKTWAACNVIAQRVSTGYGQPPSTHYDWTLAQSSMRDASYRLPDDMDVRLRIEMMCKKITDMLYGNTDDPVGLVNDKEKPVLVKLLAQELEQLEVEYKPSMNPINTVYLRAARLHLRLCVLFDPPTTPNYQEDLSNLWFAVTGFLEEAFSLKTPHGEIVKYSTNYILQMMIASAFALLKLLNSFFAHMISQEYGKTLFLRTIHTIRSISVLHNDLTSRLAEVLSQLWRSSGGSPPQDKTVDDSLQLKVRCRMSMSLVFDSVWRWREEFQSKGRDNLEAALKNPTNPESSNGSVISAMNSTVPDAQPLQPGKMEGVMPSASLGREMTPGEFGFGDWNNEVFDPLNWMLDGYVDMPYTYPGAGSSDGPVTFL